MGLRTALIEKTVLIGGLATTGLINIYLPLCDGRGRQVTFGIAEELLHLSIKYGPGDVPAGWREPGEHAERGRYRVAFSPASFVLAMDEALEAAGVTLWLDTLVCRSVMEGERIVGLEVENKSGRGLLPARASWMRPATPTWPSGQGPSAPRATTGCRCGRCRSRWSAPPGRRQRRKPSRCST